MTCRKSVFITGASSGIGKSLAFEYAKNKYVLGLTARRDQLLKEIALECNKLGGEAHAYKLDVTDSENCKKVASEFLKKVNSMDIIIANAGISGDDGIYDSNSKKINNILNTNIIGVTNSLMPFIPTLKRQGNGTLVCLSSVAGFFPIPYRGGYSSSKVAVRMIFDAWRPILNKYNIKMITICPGFIDTPIIKGPAKNFPMVSVDKAAIKFFNIIKRGNGTYVYPWFYRILIILMLIIPSRFINFILKRMFSGRKK